MGVVFLGGFRGVLMLLVQWPYFGNHYTKKPPLPDSKSMGFRG